MPNAKLVVIPSVWGHMCTSRRSVERLMMNCLTPSTAAADTNEADKAFIAKEVRKFLEE